MAQEVQGSQYIGRRVVFDLGGDKIGGEVITAWTADGVVGLDVRWDDGVVTAVLSPSWGVIGLNPEG